MEDQCAVAATALAPDSHKFAWVSALGVDPFGDEGIVIQYMKPAST